MQLQRCNNTKIHPCWVCVITGLECMDRHIFGQFVVSHILVHLCIMMCGTQIFTSLSIATFDLRTCRICFRTVNVICPKGSFETLQSKKCYIYITNILNYLAWSDLSKGTFPCCLPIPKRRLEEFVLATLSNPEWPDV